MNCPVSRHVLRALGVALLALLGGCAGLEFGRAEIDLEPPPDQIASLRTGVDDLSSCLSSLGAPTLVQTDENGRDFILTWSWLSQSDWGFFFSLPLSDAFNASLNYADSSWRPQRLRLVFDPAWNLKGVLTESPRD